MRLVRRLAIAAKTLCRVRYFAAVFVLAIACAALGAPVAGPWEQPAAALAEQIAGVLGPGPARLTIRNMSSISNDDIPAIRALIEQTLKAHGVTASSDEVAKAIRVTLSENAHERLWIAEVAEGSETRVIMVRVDPVAHFDAPAKPKIVLRTQQFLSPAGLHWRAVTSPDEPLLAVADTNHGIAVLWPGRISILFMSALGFQEVKSLPIKARQALSRDPRGVLIVAADSNGFTAFLGATQCTGAYSWSSSQPDEKAEGWSMTCRATDDPWPIVSDNAAGASQIKAFYNASRDYFTGVVAPGVGVDLPPFYSAAIVPRASGASALLIEGIDGKVQLAESGALTPVSGTRDWGSDFAMLASGCGAGTQIIASASGDAAGDSVLAYEIPAQEAVPASEPLAMNGTVMALSTAADGKSVLAIVRTAVAVGQPDNYEVDRVTASCN